MRTWLLLGTLVLGSTILAQEAPAAKGAAAPAAPAAAGLKVPAGFKAVAGTKAEPYTKTGWAQEIVHEKTGMAFVYIPAGEFLMGSPANEVEPFRKELQHRVTLAKGFYLGKYEVTQGQWEKVLGENPSGFQKAGPEAPVETVSWDDCQAFIKKLNAALPPPTTDNPQPTSSFRLPTETEWEYACRARTNGPYAGELDAMGWHNQNSGETTHPVGQKKANAWGLYDMHGNVEEWCADWFGDYPAGAVTDPTGPAAGRHRVSRGGGLNYRAGICRSADRYRLGPGFRNSYLGCRLVFSPVPGQ